MRLRPRRLSATVRIESGTMAAHCTISVDDTGEIREVFLRPTGGAPIGSDLDGLCDDAAILLSLALQFGVPPGKLRSSLGSAGGEATSLIGAAVDAITKESGLQTAPPSLPRWPAEVRRSVVR